MAETILTDNTTQKEDFIPSPENQNIGKREIIENKLEKSSIVTPDPNAAIEKIESDNITFKEHKYSASSLTAFTAFQLKIVMTGTSSCYPPVVKDLRGIALAV